jgi:hypothetical protein
MVNSGLLVSTHQRAVTGDVGDENGSQPACRPSALSVNRPDHAHATTIRMADAEAQELYLPTTADPPVMHFRFRAFQVGLASGVRFPDLAHSRELAAAPVRVRSWGLTGSKLAVAGGLILFPPM